MAKYIDAEALIASIDGNPYVSESVKSYVRVSVRKAPAADVAEVVHGEWIPDRDTHKCSSCGFGMFMHGNTYFFQDGVCLGSGRKMLPYCPNCGARMDGMDGEKE